MKTMTIEKPAEKATRTAVEKQGVPERFRRSMQRALKVPAELQMAEIERTFSVRWEW